MVTRQPLPRTWLVTDERQGEQLLGAVARLPRGTGILFRHYRLPAAERRVLFHRVASIARRRRLIVLLAGTPAIARRWGADGWHGRRPGRGLHSVAVHGLAEMRAAERNGASLLFLSPVFPTRSHPGAAGLGCVRFGLLAQKARRPVIALGGLTRRNLLRLTALGAYGWGAIDAWIE